MDNYRLHTFSDGVLIDELITEPALITISKIGAARYEISVVDESGRQIVVALWTTKKGNIITQLDGIVDWITVRAGSDGYLLDLTAPDCSLHLEHLDRGLYWLALNHLGGETMHINFSTPGYLSTKIVKQIINAGY